MVKLLTMTDKKLLLTFTEESLLAPFKFNGVLVDRLKRSSNWIKILLSKVPFMPLHVALNLPNKFFIVYEVGTIGNPISWTGLCSSDNSNVVEMLPESLKERIREKSAVVYYDQSWEGFPMIDNIDNYYEKFYKVFQQLKLPPSQFILSTSNLLEASIHDEWCKKNSIDDRMTIISANFFAAMSAQSTFYGQGVTSDITFDEHIQYKSSNNIVLFNCLNRVIREHRVGFIAMLNYYGLLQSNKVSHDRFPFHFQDEIKVYNYNHHPAFENNNVIDINSKLPLILDSKQFEVNKAQNFFTEVYLESWVTVVTETLTTEINTMFFSEKIYKPIRARHPFILIGIRGSLRELKRQGFKTFDTWWDESYDDIENITDRMDFVCKLLLELQTKSKEQWLTIYTEMNMVLEHNYNHLNSCNWIEPLSSCVNSINNE